MLTTRWSRTASTLILVAAVLAPAAAASRDVLEVPGPDAVVVELYQLPVRVRLANIAVPENDEIRERCQARLVELVGGKSVEVLYLPEFGVDEQGTGRVQVRLGSQNVNSVLVSEGLARYVPSESGASAFDRMLELAQDRAREQEVGVWAAAPEPEAPVVASADAPATPAEPAAATSADTAASGPIVAELNGRYYYAAEDPRVADINPQRLIFYPDERSARRAGKRPAPERVATAEVGGDEALELYNEGRELYRQALAAGNTTLRDDLYGEAFVKLTQAMQVYTRLVEAAPQDAALAERLREIRQLRYGAMKQRRY